MEFNIRHLRAMLAIMASGRISAAARAVNLTQPAVTQGIAKLEAQLGLALFERRSDGMAPTDAARVLAPRAEAALRLIGRNPTAAQMRALLALADTGGYAAAAVATGLSEASLHRAVGDLSIGLSQRLVERRGRGVALTARGAATARSFRLALVELRAGLAELEALQGREVGRIVIGAMPLSRARLLPEAIGRFHARYRHVDLSIVEGSYTELAGPLRDGEIDLLVGALRAQPSQGIAQEALFEDRPSVIARAGHPLTGRALTGRALTGQALTGQALTMDVLARYPWVLPSRDTPLRLQWEAMFDAPPRVPIESGSVMMVRQVLVGSDFLTLLSPDQVSVEIEAGWLVSLGIPPGDISRTIGISTREGWRPTALQEGFLSTLRNF